MGCVVLGFAFGFLDVALGLGLLDGLEMGGLSRAYLGGGVASHGTHGTLGEARGLVQVGLAGGSVSVRHSVDCW